MFYKVTETGTTSGSPVLPVTASVREVRVPAVPSLGTTFSSNNPPETFYSTVEEVGILLSRPASLGFSGKVETLSYSRPRHPRSRNLIQEYEQEVNYAADRDVLLRGRRWGPDRRDP